jgi:3-oxoacyl-[acyl-carrier protein] reductase
MDLGLRGRAYLVTGGTRGLGYATARELARDGADVLVSGRTAEAAEDAARRLGEGVPGRTAGLGADNADPGTPRRLLDAARERFGRLDGVLVSVGGPPAGTSGQLDPDQWRAAFETVFLGAVRLAQEAAAELEAGGVIGFVLSGSVYEPIAGLTLSNGLRPGLAGYAKSLATELGPRGIRVVGVLPGHIDTDRVRELDARHADPEAARARAAESIPLRRYGTPEEFGRAAAFLLSPAASYLTGVMLPVDGGVRRGI